MRIKKIFILVYAVLLIVHSSFGQDYSHRQLTTQDGLPTNHVYGVVEDNDGYIWAYTEKGISKFDGYNFNNYSIENGLPANDIYQIEKSKDGTLWFFGIGNSAGYIKNDSIFNINLHSATKSIFKSTGDELIYRNGTKKWLVKDGYLEKNKINHSLKIAEGVGLEVKPKNNYFSYNYKNGELIEYEGESISTITQCALNNPKSYSGHSIHYIDIGQPYYLIVGKLGVLLIDQKTKQQNLTKWNSHFKNDITMSNVSVVNKEVTISTNNGLVIIDKDKNIQSYAFPELAKQYTLRRSYKDQFENIWVCTKEGGIFFHSKEQLQSILINSTNTNDNIFKHILQTQSGQVIAITSKGAVYDLYKEELIRKPTTSSVYDAKITTNGHLLLTFNSEPLKEVCLHKKKCSKLSIDEKLLNFTELRSGYLKNNLRNTTNIKGIIIQNDSDVYINSFVFEKTYIDEKGEANNKVIGNSQRLIVQLPGSKIIYSADKENLFQLSANNDLKKILSLPLISSVCEFGQTGLLIGTESSGLYKYTFDDNQIKKIGKYGSTTHIYYNNNTIYTSSNEGIFKLELEGNNYKQTKFWGTNQGLPSLEVFDFIIDADQLIACTNNGIAKINLNASQQLLTDNSKLKITNSKINEQDIQAGEKMSYNENDLNINFSLLDIKSLGNIKYQYKLAPIQMDWQSTRDQNVIFNNLAPNDYSFSLKAIDNTNNTYQLENEFNFTIRKPYWQTLPFLLISICSITGIFLFYEKMRKEKLNKELEQAKEQNKRFANLKLEALRSQMNPHFVFNALGAIQYYIQTHKVDDADNYLTLFASLMRKYLDSSSEQMISIQDEVALLDDYIKLEMMRFEDMFTYKLEIDPSLDQSSILIPSMMIQPYVENAVNHGLPHRKDGKAQLIISFNPIGNENIIIKIKDNGIGREQAKDLKKNFHKSKGMTNVASRIESLINAEVINIKIDITDNSNDVQFPGTSVNINLKKQNNWNTQQSL